MRNVNPETPRSPGGSRLNGFGEIEGTSGMSAKANRRSPWRGRGPVDRLAEPALPVVAGEQGESAVAGGREAMRVPRFVEMPDALAMGGRHAMIVPAGRPGHTPRRGDPQRHCWTRQQWQPAMRVVRPRPGGAARLKPAAARSPVNRAGAAMRVGCHPA